MIIKKRIALVLIGIFIALAVLGLRVAWLQFIDGNRLASKMQSQLKERFSLYSPRGVIYDRDGHALAISAMRKSLYADPGEIPAAKREEIANLLAPILETDATLLLERLNLERRFVWIRRTLEPDVAKQIEALIAEGKVSGLHFLEESKRYYPNGALASHVLGFVGIDDIGLEGLELSYDYLISGKKQEQVIETDSQGVPIFKSVYPGAANKIVNVYLTLDANIQFIVEKSLDQLMAKRRAQAATVIIMDVKTGEVLAMASRPGFDPNHFSSYDAASFRNRAIATIYEPGSTFKAIVAAAALQEGLVSPDELFEDKGQITIGGITVSNWDSKGRGFISFRDIIKDSVNTGFVMVGERLGITRLMHYTKQFGFGHITELSLPGEESGLLFDAAVMRQSDLASASIGQGVAVTPIQLLTAVAAIANDGVLLKPQIVKELVTDNNEIIKRSAPEAVRQVISPQTAKELTVMLEQVVTEGGGQQAAVPGYRFAGKTGTAEKVKLSGPGYEQDRYIASFVGFGPVEAPQLAALIIIDEPSGAYYGGQVAAPVFREIMTQIMLYRSLQQPVASLKLHQAERPLLPVMEATPDKQGTCIVPDVRGKPIREAARLINNVGLAFTPIGTGLAVGQSPKPGLEVPLTTNVQVTFAPPN